MEYVLFDTQAEAEEFLAHVHRALGFPNKNYSRYSEVLVNPDTGAGAVPIDSRCHNLLSSSQLANLVSYIENFVPISVAAQSQEQPPTEADPPPPEGE